MNFSLPNQNATRPNESPAMPLVPNARADMYTADPRLLDDPHTCIVLGHIGLYKRALILDIELLMQEYIKRGTSDFQTFSSVWKELRFSLIHMGCTEKHGREAFMNCTYQILLAYFQEGYTHQIQIAAAFALYMLYFTQPFSFPKVGIRLTLDRWKMLEQFYARTCQVVEEQVRQEQQQQQQSSDEVHHGWEDAVYTILKLREADAFLFVARDDPVGSIMPFDRPDAPETAEMKLLQLERDIMTKEMEPSPSLVDELDKFDKLYHVSKQSLLGTELTEQAINLVQSKLDRHEQLRSMSSGPRARRLDQPANSTLLLFDPFEHLDEQLQTLRGVRDPQGVKSDEKRPREGASQHPQQHQPPVGNSLSATPSTGPSANPATSSVLATYTSQEGEPPTTATPESGDGNLQTPEATQSRPAKKHKRSGSLFLPTKTDIADDFEELLKHHARARWKRLEYAVQGKLDSFSREETQG